MPRMRFSRHPSLTVGLFALLVRLTYCTVAFFVLGKSAPGGPSHDGYLEIAQSLVAGHGYRLLGELNYFRPPTYVLFLVPWVALPGTVFWIVVAQSILGAATCGMVAHLAGRFVARPWAVAAGLVLAINPWHVHFSANTMTPILGGFLVMSLAIAWYASYRNPILERFSLCGFIFGALALCHPASALIGPFWILDRVRVWWREANGRRSIVAMTSFTLSALLIMSPWIIRNRRNTGEWILLTNAMGFQYIVSDAMISAPGSLFVPPTQSFTAGLARAHQLLADAGFKPSATLILFKGVGIEEGKFCKRWMINDLRANPQKIVSRLVRQGWWFWFSDKPSYVILHLIFELPLLILAVIGVGYGLRCGQLHVPLGASILAFWIAHAAIMGHIPLAAYCLNVMGPTCVLAAIGAQGLISRQAVEEQMSSASKM